MFNGNRVIVERTRAIIFNIGENLHRQGHKIEPLSQEVWRKKKDKLVLIENRFNLIQISANRTGCDTHLCFPPVSLSVQRSNHAKSGIVCRSEPFLLTLLCPATSLAVTYFLLPLYTPC